MASGAVPTLSRGCRLPMNCGVADEFRTCASFRQKLHNTRFISPAIHHFGQGVDYERRYVARAVPVAPGLRSTPRCSRCIVVTPFLRRTGSTVEAAVCRCSSRRTSVGQMHSSSIPRLDQTCHRALRPTDRSDHTPGPRTCVASRRWAGPPVQSNDS